MVTKDRLRCENIGSVVCSSITIPVPIIAGPYVNSIQVVKKRAII